MKLSTSLIIAVAVAGAAGSQLGGQLGARDAMEAMHAHTTASGVHTAAAAEAAAPSPIPHVMHHQHGMPILQTDLLPAERLYWEHFNTTNYFNHPSANAPALWSHIIVLLVAVVFVYPIALVFKNLGRWRCYAITLCVHSLLVVASLLRYSQFMSSIPDLYPSNAYNTMSWILLFSTLTQLLSFFTMHFTNPTESYVGLGPGSSGSRLSGNSLHGGVDYSRDTSNEYSDADEIKEFSSSVSLLDRFRGIECIQVLSRALSKVSVSINCTSRVLFNFLHWAHFFYFMVYIGTGVATFLLLGKGSTVFNLLAHFIKGGVFFAYGILSLSRYCGVFENKGWAWNHKVYTGSLNRWGRLQPKGLITMEMIESSLILFYGSTNIFLEHLANPGGEWSAKDLQHASIAFIFIGCGLCGVITEMKLSDWRYERAASCQSDEESVLKASPGFSPNPFPLLTIYWTGYLMSKHEQSSATATEIHTQWGNLFVLACAFRLITYLMQLLMKPAKETTQPSRPMSELLVSFALICGGMIFMESCEPVVLLFEWYGLNSMFTLNVSLGISTLLMGWQMSVFCFRDWLKVKES